MKQLGKYLLFMMIAALAACNGNDKGSTSGSDSLSGDPAMVDLQKKNSELETQLAEQTENVEAFENAFTEIQNNLNTIKEKEKIITNASKEGNVKAVEDQINEDIQAIYELMEKNRQKVASLNSKLKSSNTKMEGLEKMIANLEVQIQQKDAEITDLKSKLEQLNIEINELTLASQVKDEEISQKTTKLNTAYYAYGTTKELKRQGVITKEGGFIGLGKSESMMKDFNKNYFTKIDITQTTSIPLAAKEAKLLTSHPSTSYKFEGPKGKVEKLVITNPEEFWATSKYLVIIID
jgi:septal ring factor EnvC (AmiA/AmiB activator)